MAAFLESTGLILCMEGTLQCWLQNAAEFLLKRHAKKFPKRVLRHGFSARNWLACEEEELCETEDQVNHSRVVGGPKDCCVPRLQEF